MKKLIVFSMALLFLFTFSPVLAKSVYVIADINGYPTPVRAYDIQPAPTYLLYQASYGVPRFGGGGVGLAIDTDSKVLFVTYEVSNIIQLLDATTMTSLGTTTAPGASNLAGIVVDQDNALVYTVDRNTNKLYIYNWNAVTKVLTLNHIEYLPGVYSAHGIALDEINDLLYVGDRTKTVKIFNTGTWTPAGTFNVSQDVMGIAVDVSNGLVYTGNAYPGYGSIHLLCQYNLNTNSETTLHIGASDNVVGLAVDQKTGLLYLTTGNQGFGGSDQLRVYNSSLALLYNTGDIGNPTGVVVPGKEVGYNPLQLTKDDGIAAGNCAAIGSNINYTISYNNANNSQQVTNVVLTDYLPAELDYVSSTGGGVYNAGPRTVTWNIGTLPAGFTGASVSLVTTVNSNATLGGTVTNSCKIASTETGESTVNETSDICQQVDTTPPSCTLVAVNPGPPLSIDVAMQDGESGLKTITVLQAVNAVYTPPTFMVGTTSPVVFHASKADNSLPGYIVFQVEDVAGNTTVCDPVYTKLFTGVPEDYQLKQNYPNPFNPTTTIEFGLASGPVEVALRVYDVSGREIKTLINEVMEAGNYQVEWDGTNQRGEAVAGGVYVYRLVAGDYVINRKMILLK